MKNVSFSYLKNELKSGLNLQELSCLSFMKQSQHVLLLVVLLHA